MLQKTFLFKSNFLIFFYKFVVNFQSNRFVKHHFKNSIDLKYVVTNNPCFDKKVTKKEIKMKGLKTIMDFEGLQVNKKCHNAGMYINIIIIYIYIYIHTFSNI